MFPIVVDAPVLPVVPVVLAPVVVAPRFQGWVGFAPAWEVHMDWMEDYEYMIWHRWQRMIAHRHLSVIERRRMLLDLIRRENRFESTKKVDRLADRMLGMEEDLGADEWGHVVSEETTTTTTTTTAQQQQQQRREQEEEQMNVRRANAANGLIDAAKESGNQDIASLRRTQEMILAGKMDDLVLAQEEEQQSSRVSRRKRAIMPAMPGPSTPVQAMTAPPTPGPSTPRRVQGRSNAGGHSYSSQSLQQSFEAPVPQAQQAPMPQPQYQQQAPPPAPNQPHSGPQSAMYNYNQQQFQQSVQNPPPAPPPTNQNYQQGAQQYNQSIQQQQQRQQQPIPAEKPKRRKNRESRSSRRHHHYTHTTTTTTVTTSNTASDDVEEDAQQPQYRGPQYGKPQYGQSQYGHHQQFAPPPQQTPDQPRQITQSGDIPTATFSGQATNQSVPMPNACFNPSGGYPGQSPGGSVPSNDFGQVKKKKEKKSKTAISAGSQVVGQKGQREKEKKKKEKYDEL
ncbi:hypothetical protein D0869_03327 [Hortaea werneckii]|uniref:Uncharacterized protein n=1 Tax=Hortaea werneckii TaxID=91943 RepID=A0A3M6X5P1_HORWE|nr:hypothetical protein D0869_03327 [Hortaea werneckii]